MSDKLLPPRIPEGRELEYWIRNISSKIGVDPPATLEELGMSSTATFHAEARRLSEKIDGLERKLTQSRALYNELVKRIDGLERSI